jgi:hypothetical protein
MAEADAVVTNVEVITRAAKNGDWRAAAWFLEHKYPDRWARLEKRQLEELQAEIRAERHTEDWEQTLKAQNEFHEIVANSPRAREAAKVLLECSFEHERRKQHEKN